MKKIKDLLNKFKKIDPKELEIFISEILGKDKSFVTAHPEHKLTLRQYLKIIYFVYQRKRGYSVAAIVRHKEFYNLDFFVNKHVLIPRPETEMMVEEAIRILTTDYRLQTSAPDRQPKSEVRSPILLIDMGTGSGCIPIAIIKTLAHKNINTIATDISRSALRVAKKNASKHNINIKFLHGNLLEPILQNPSLCLSPYRGEMSEQKNVPLSVVPSPIRGGAGGGVIVTANLPYLTEHQFQNEPSIWREPKKALVAKNNGLALYEELLKQIIKFKIYNLKFIILFEIDPSQSPAIVKLIKKYLPQTKISASPDIFFAHSGKKKEFSFRSFDLKIEIKKDLAGRDRLAVIKNLTL